MYFLSQNKSNLSILELKRLVGLSYPSAWRMKHKLMQVMYERESTTRLSGRVEIDDAYLGGENPGGKAGRGSENKVPFIAAVQTNNQNNPVYAAFSKVKAFRHSEVCRLGHPDAGSLSNRRLRWPLVLHVCNQSRLRPAAGNCRPRSQKHRHGMLHLGQHDPRQSEDRY